MHQLPFSTRLNITLPLTSAYPIHSRVMFNVIPASRPRCHQLEIWLVITICQFQLHYIVVQHSCCWFWRPRGDFLEPENIYALNNTFSCLMWWCSAGQHGPTPPAPSTAPRRTCLATEAVLPYIHNDFLLWTWIQSARQCTWAWASELPRQMESGAVTVKQSSEGNWPAEPLPIELQLWHGGTQRQASRKENKSRSHDWCSFYFQYYSSTKLIILFKECFLSFTLVICRWQHSSDSLMQRSTLTWNWWIIKRILVM